MAPEKDPQLDRVNAQLRDNGSPPERDLWPGISATITAEEKRIRRGKIESSSSFLGPKWLWAAAAMAAFALMLVPLGFQTDEMGLVTENVPQKLNAEMAFGQSESALTGALRNLEKAVQENPGDQNLSRLFRMVNSRQGDLLRHKWAENSRVQDMLNGGVS